MKLTLLDGPEVGVCTWERTHRGAKIGRRETDQEASHTTTYSKSSRRRQLCLDEVGYSCSNQSSALEVESFFSVWPRGAKG